MALAGLLVDLRALVADGRSLAAELLDHELDHAVTMLMHVPVHECSRPLAGLIHASKGPKGVLRPVFGRAEQRLGVLVLSLDSPRAREGAQHPVLLQQHLQRGGTHGAAVIGVQNQLALALLADPLPAVGAELGGIQASRLKHQRELVGSAPDLWLLLGGRHHLSLQPPALPPFVEGHHVNAQLL